MGCISSKIMTRSRSFQEEVSLSLQRRTNGLPVLEDLLITKNGGDQFLALLCTANTVAKKLKAETQTKESVNTTNPPSEPTNPEMINTWELMADLEEEEEVEEEEQQQLQQQTESSVSMPSRSFHKTEEDKLCSEDNSPHEVQVINSSGDMGESITRSKSFRTVEEFDAIVSGNFLIERPEVVNKSSIHSSDHVNGEGISTQQEGQQQPFPHEDVVLVENAKVFEVSSSSDEHHNTKIKSVHAFAWSRSYSASEVATVKENITRNRNLTNEKGLRRKAMAKDLTTLKVPSFDFSSIGSLKEWLNTGGQVFSPGSYVTPKFGNFTLPAPKSGDTGGEYSFFDPELVADFEEAMEQLTMEEEHILKQIVENFEDAHKDDTEEKEIRGHME